MSEKTDNQEQVRRILIVEDEATLAFFLAHSLMSEAEDYEVLTARDGEMAVAKMEEKPFDVVISDIVLPRMDGLSVLRQTRKQWPRTRVILMTAYGSHDIKNRASHMDNPWRGENAGPLPGRSPSGSDCASGSLLHLFAGKQRRRNFEMRKGLCES
jgi:CheY-like chemotaxis protein